MGTTPPNGPGCINKCTEALQQTRQSIVHHQMFSNTSNPKPYAIPIKQNIYTPSAVFRSKIQKVIKQEEISKTNPTESLVGYEYDESYWKKQEPDVVIQGHWRQRLPHGLCRIYFPNGKLIFVSYFNNGIPILDDCLIVYEKGSYYHGGLNLNFKFQGSGKYANQDESIVYIGQWKNNLPVGKGKETFLLQNETVEYEGDFNNQGQRQCKSGEYRMISKGGAKDETKKNITTYIGSFKNNNFEQGTLKAKGSTLKGVFKSENIEVHELTTEKYVFQGQLQRNFYHGQGKIKQTNKKGQNIVYSGIIADGKLNGEGLVIRQDGSKEKVYWFQGTKLRLFRNFNDSIQTLKILAKVQQQYKKAEKYSQLSKILEDCFNGWGSKINTSLAQSQKESFFVEMISEEKVRTILNPQSNNKTNMSPRHLPSSNPSTLGSNRKQLILQLSKGKNLYITCYKIPGSARDIGQQSQKKIK